MGTPASTRKSPMASLSQVLVPRLQVPLAVALSSAERLVQSMAEAEALCSHVSQRLLDLYESLQRMDAVPVSILDKFLWQSFRFHDFVSKFSNKKLVTRLVCSRKILEQTRSLHRELDVVADALRGVCDLDLSAGDWESQWEHDRRVLRQGWGSLREDRTRLTAELLDTASQVEAMVLLKCEKETYFAKYAPDDLELLNAVFGYAASLSHAEVPHVPRWFIPPHEVDFVELPFSKGAFGSVHHGTWLDARVVVKRMLNPVDNELERSLFMNEIRICAVRYHVVKLKALPSRPERLTDEQWGLVEKMCAFEPTQRPEIAVVVEKLKHFAEKETNDKFDHVTESWSVYASSGSEASTNSRMATNTSAAAGQSHSALLSSAAASSQSSGRTFSSSACSIATLAGEESSPMLDLDEYLSLLATLVDAQCEAIDEICKEAKDLQLPEPENYITQRYDDRMLDLRSEWMAKNRVAQDTLTTCMLIYDGEVELKTTRVALQQKLLQHATEAVQVFDGMVDPARAF
ncbi:hypothetical protein PRIC2_004578 [Phytophthora ramorum]